MANYTKKPNGQYMRDGDVVKAAEVPQEVKDALAAVDSGVAVDEAGNTVETGDGVEGATNTPTSENELDDLDDDELDADDSSDAPTAPEPPQNPKSDELAKQADKDAKARAKAAKEAEKSGEPTTDSLPENPVDSGLKQDERGMGFPRVKGYTVDIFDLKTPHTHVKNVQGIMVPLSAKSHAEKSEAAIMERIEELRKEGKVTV